MGRFILLACLLAAIAGQANADDQATGAPFLRPGELRPAPQMTVATTTPAGRMPQRITPPEQSAATEAAPATDAEAPKPRATSLATVVALSALVLVVLFVGRAWKKNGGFGSPTAPIEAIELLGKRYVDPRQTIHLVRLGTRILVIGSTPGGLQPLAEVTDPVEVDYLAGLCRANHADGTVSRTFRSLLAGRSQQQQSAPTPGAREQRLQQLRAGGRPIASREGGHV